MKKVISFMAALALALAVNSAFAIPANFSFSGTFADDDNVQLFSFTAGGASTVRLISYSYGGGIQANGNVVSAGGFDPILALFDSTGAVVGQDDDAVSSTPGACGSGVVTPDPITGRQWDTCLDLPALLAGTYTVGIMQYDNFALGPNLSNGFEYVGQPNFTATISSCSNGQFCDVTGDSRQNHWAFDVLNVERAVQVPEPASLALMGLGLVGLGFSLCRKRVS